MWDMRSAMVRLYKYEDGQDGIDQPSSYMKMVEAIVEVCLTNFGTGEAKEAKEAAIALCLLKINNGTCG